MFVEGFWVCLCKFKFVCLCSGRRRRSADELRRFEGPRSEEFGLDVFVDSSDLAVPSPRRSILESKYYFSYKLRLAFQWNKLKTKYLRVTSTRAEYFLLMFGRIRGTRVSLSDLGDPRLERCRFRFLSGRENPRTPFFEVVLWLNV